MLQAGVHRHRAKAVGPLGLSGQRPFVRVKWTFAHHTDGRRKCGSLAPDSVTHESLYPSASHKPQRYTELPSWFHASDIPVVDGCCNCSWRAAGQSEPGREHRRSDAGGEDSGNHVRTDCVLVTRKEAAPAGAWEQLTRFPTDSSHLACSTPQARRRLNGSREENPSRGIPTVDIHFCLGAAA
jgi:hypothetical protein